jgi:hypothetical protein
MRAIFLVICGATALCFITNVIRIFKKD